MPKHAERPAHAGRHRPTLILFLAVAAAVVTADLVVKSLAFAKVAGQPVELQPFAAKSDQLIPPHEAVTAIPGVLSLKLTLNRGAAFGMGQGGRWLFVGVALLAVVFVTAVFWRSQRREWLLHLALALLLGGALGNLYDRIVFGVVRDMCWLFPTVKLPFGWHWPGGSEEIYPWIFNVADAAMCLALATLVLLMFVHKKASKGERT